MKKNLIFSFAFFTIILLSISFVSASWFDDLFSVKYSGNVIQKISESSQTFIRKGESVPVSLDSGEYNLEIKNVAPVGSGESFVRGTITRPDGIQEEISVHTGEEVTLQRGEVVSVSKIPTNKPFGRKNIEVSIQENKLEEAEGVLFFSHFHENVGTIDETSGDEYILYSDAGIYKIEIAPEDEIMNMRLEQMIGNNLKVSGLKKDNTISISFVSVPTKLEDSAKRLIQTTGQEFRKPFSPPIIDKPIPAIKNQTRYKMAVFLIDFQDSGARPFSRSEAEEKLFGNSAGSLRGMIKEQSYNKASVTGQVFDWITVPRNSLEQPTTYSTTASSQRCYAMDDDSSQFIQEEVLPLMPQTTKDELSKYNRIYFLTYCPQYQMNLGGYASLFDMDNNFSNEEGWIVGGFSMFNFNNFPSAWQGMLRHIEHEFIHIVIYPKIVWHAAGYDCGEKTLGTNNECSFLEAGNCYDIMGKVLSAGICSEHVNSRYKEDIGWLSPREMLTITESGTYKLKPLEYSSRGVKAAKIESSGIPLFYLEFRQPIGMDSNLNNFEISSNQDGLFILISPFIDSRSGSLIDARPSALSWEEDLKDVTLNVGDSFFYNFSSNNFNVTIKPINVKKSVPQEITFDVEINQQKPTCASTFSNSKPFVLPFNYFNDVYFDLNNGWVITLYGKLYNSIDGGNSWKNIPVIEENFFNGKIQFITQDIGWITGFDETGSGIIFNTINGGETWTIQFKEVSFIPRGIQFIDQFTGWIVGNELEDESSVFKTTNGGETWQKQLSPDFGSISKFYFIDANYGWAIPDANPYYFYYTADGGETWISSQEFPSFIRNLYFLNQDIGWIAGTENIFKTIDGGQSWTNVLIPSYYFYDIQFRDANNGLATGYDWINYQLTFFYTNDGGESWFDIFTKNLDAPFTESNSYFLNKNQMWLNTGKEIYCINDKFQQELKEEV